MSDVASGGVPLPLRFAIREMRAGLRGFYVLVLCITPSAMAPSRWKSILARPTCRERSTSRSRRPPRTRWQCSTRECAWADGCTRRARLPGAGLETGVRHL